MTPRDPRRDPKVGDVVRGCWRKPMIHVGKQNQLTVEAVCGNLIATSNGEGDILWRYRDGWCATDVWTESFEVIHAAE